MSSCGSDADDIELLIERMNTVRSAGYSHAEQLQGEAKRLVDWREYVLAKPISSVAFASILGFVITRSTMNSTPRPISNPLPLEKSELVNASVPASFAGGVIGLATSIASSAIKSYVANWVQARILERSSHDRLREDQVPIEIRN